MPWPSERPTSGSRWGPSTTSAMIRTMMILAGESKPDIGASSLRASKLRSSFAGSTGSGSPVASASCVSGPASAVGLGFQLREQAVELRHLGAQAGQVHDDPLLRRSRQHDDRLLIRGGVLLAVRDVRRHVDVVAGARLDPPLLIVFEEHAEGVAGHHVDAGPGLAVVVVARDHPGCHDLLAHPELA